MSGEASGVIGGGILVIAGLPYILVAAAGAAAIAGTAAAVYQVGKGIQKAEKRHQETVDLEKCSEQLQRFYDSFRSRSAELDMQNARFYKSTLESLQALKLQGYEDVRNMNFDSIREEVISSGREKLFASMDHAFADYAIVVNERFQQESRLQETELRNYKAINDRTAQMIASIENTENEQRQLAEQLREDAMGIIRLLENESGAFGNVKSDHIRAIKHLLDSVETDYGMGSYEKVIIACNSVIEKGMLLLQDIQKEGSRREFLHNQLASRYEYLNAWLDKIRYVDMDADENYEHDIHEDLNDFCQGKVRDLSDRIRNMLETLASEECDSWTDIMYREEIEYYDKKLIPQAERTISAAYSVLQNYLKKVDIIEILMEFMDEQGYDVDWAMPKGDDLSQQMVAHFTNPASQSEISIVLDVDSPVEEFSNVAIDILSYEQGESSNIEIKREKMRTAMMEALQKRNIMLHAPLTCKCDTVNRSSVQMDYNNEDKVAQMKPTILFS